MAAMGSRIERRRIRRAPAGDRVETGGRTIDLLTRGRFTDEALGAASRVLLVAAPGTLRTLLAAALRDAGCHVAEAGTPLEAIVVLDDGARRWLLAIADSVSGATADELRAYVTEAHPDARVISLGRSRTRPAWPLPQVCS